MGKRNLKNKKIIFLGKLPPPYIGPAVATGIILHSSLAREYRLIHLDTSDHRGINRLGVIDFKNIILPIIHYLKLIALIVRYWPQAVYIPSAQTTIAYVRDIPFILITKIFRRKVICHLRGGNFRNWYEEGNALTRWLVRRVSSLIDGQIVLGKKLLSMFDGLMLPEKLFVVPNGGDIPVDKDPKDHFEKKRILYLANFIRSKGVLDVLNAIAAVFLEFSGVEFVFAGSWTDKKTHLDFIRFVHAHPELPITVMAPVFGKRKFDLLKSADIFVFPTYYVNEGHPWVVIEAMAAGLPIITTDHGVISDSIVDGVNGFLIGKQNPEQIAGKLKLLLGNPQLQKKMGDENRRLYLRDYTEEKMIGNLRSCFEKILANK